MQYEERPNYDPDAVKPMRAELTGAGFVELLTAEDVDGALKENRASEDQTALFMLNSVCGCAAGSARPGVTLALQNKIIPDKLFSAFAGMEKAAVRRLREALEPNLPSSPAMALFKNGELVEMIHRHNIENHSAQEVAAHLVEVFNHKCSAEGPSIPREKYNKLVSPDICGSTLELMD